jgi:hypothetical protein
MCCRKISCRGYLAVASKSWNKRKEIRAVKCREQRYHESPKPTNNFESSARALNIDF